MTGSPPATPDPNRATELLQRMQGGDASAENDLLRLLYADLKQRAERCMRSQPPDHTLQPTALIHEAYLKVAGRDRSWHNREHFLAVAATAMRQILVDHARAQKAARRPQFDAAGSDLDIHAHFEMAIDVLALHEALEKLSGFDPVMARAVELRFFSGMSSEEAARVVGVSRRTIDRKWATTLAWLHREIA